MNGEELVELEVAGWEALCSGQGAEFYGALMAEDAIMLLPVGLLERDASIDALRGQGFWDSYELDDVRVVLLSEESAIVAYTATAQREGRPAHRALMSTTYVWREDEWLIACHQQTPLDAE